MEVEELSGRIALENKIEVMYFGRAGHGRRLGLPFVPSTGIGNRQGSCGSGGTRISPHSWNAFGEACSLARDLECIQER